MKRFATLALIFALAPAAFAHSRVEHTAPLNGSAIGTVPAEISMTFDADIRLTRVDLTHQDEKAVRLDLGEQTRFDRMFSLPLDDKGAGVYRIKWRGLGQDGHAMQGEFSFTVN